MFRKIKYKHVQCLTNCRFYHGYRYRGNRGKFTLSAPSYYIKKCDLNFEGSNCNLQDDSQSVQIVIPDGIGPKLLLEFPQNHIVSLDFFENENENKVQGSNIIMHAYKKSDVVYTVFAVKVGWEYSEPIEYELTYNEIKKLPSHQKELPTPKRLLSNSFFISERSEAGCKLVGTVSMQQEEEETKIIMHNLEGKARMLGSIDSNQIVAKQTLNRQCVFIARHEKKYINENETKQETWLSLWTIIKPQNQYKLHLIDDLMINRTDIEFNWLIGDGCNLTVETVCKKDGESHTAILHYHNFKRTGAYCLDTAGQNETFPLIIRQDKDLILGQRSNHATSYNPWFKSFNYKSFTQVSDPYEDDRERIEYVQLREHDTDSRQESYGVSEDLFNIKFSNTNGDVTASKTLLSL